MTFSIVALDPATGAIGVAVQSKFLAVGSVVPWAAAGVGAVATQSFANPRYGPNALELLGAGVSARDALETLVGDDPLRSERQAGIVDAHGGSATYTGLSCFAWAGGRTGRGYAAQGNILASAAVVDGLAETFLAGGKPFPELLVDCLVAADAAGGDRRGRQSAALCVARQGAGYGGNNDRWIDLRVDDHVDPIGELRRLLDLHRLYLDTPAESDLLPLDESLAAEVRLLLTGMGAEPGGRFGTVYQPMFPADGGNEGPGPADSPGVPPGPERPATGTPRSIPSNWSADWERALDDWMAVENLESRMAARGWIDPRVLAVLRARAG